MEFVRCDNVSAYNRVKTCLLKKCFRSKCQGDYCKGFYVCREKKEFFFATTADFQEIQSNDFLKLMAGEVIHCSTRDDFKKALEYFEQANAKWFGFDSSVTSNLGTWSIHESNTCIDPRVGERQIHHGPKDVYEDFGCEVVSLDEFIRRRTVVHCRYPSEKIALIRHLEQSGHKLYHANIREACCRSSESLINLPASGEDEVRCMTQDEIKAKGYVTTVMAEDFLRSNARKIAVLLPDEQSRQLMIRYFSSRKYQIPQDIKECLGVSHHQKLTTGSEERYRNLGYQVLSVGEFLLGMRGMTAVHCESREEWDAVLSYFGARGITWSTGLSCCLQRGLYSGNYCINIDPTQGLNYSSLSYYKSHRYNVISAQDFLSGDSQPTVRCRDMSSFFCLMYYLHLKGFKSISGRSPLQCRDLYSDGAYVKIAKDSLQFFVSKTKSEYVSDVVFLSDKLPRPRLSIFCEPARRDAVIETLRSQGITWNSWSEVGSFIVVRDNIAYLQSEGCADIDATRFLKIHAAATKKAICCDKLEQLKPIFDRLDGMGMRFISGINPAQVCLSFCPGCHIILADNVISYHSSDLFLPSQSAEDFLASEKVKTDKISLVCCNDADEWKAVLEYFGKDAALRWKYESKKSEGVYSKSHPYVYIGGDGYLWRLWKDDFKEQKHESIAARDFLEAKGIKLASRSDSQGSDAARKPLLGKVIACRRESEWRIVSSYLRKRGIADADSLSISDFHEIREPRILIDDREDVWVISDESARTRSKLVSFWQVLGDMKIAVSPRSIGDFQKILNELDSDSWDFSEGFCFSSDSGGMTYNPRDFYEASGYRVISSAKVLDVPIAISFSSERLRDKVLDYFKKDERIAARNASLIADRRHYDPGAWLVVSGDKLFYSCMVDMKPLAYAVCCDSDFLSMRANCSDYVKCRTREEFAEVAYRFQSQGYCLLASTKWRDQETYVYCSGKDIFSDVYLNKCCKSVAAKEFLKITSNRLAIRCPTEIHWINALAGMPAEARWEDGKKPLDNAHLFGQYYCKSCILLIDGIIRNCPDDSPESLIAKDCPDVTGTVVYCRNNKDLAAVLKQARKDGDKTLITRTDPKTLSGSWYDDKSICVSITHSLVHFGNIERYQQFNIKTISSEQYVFSKRKVAILCHSESQWQRVLTKLREQGFGTLIHDVSGYVQGYKPCLSVSEIGMHRGYEGDYRASGFRIVSATRYLGDLNWPVCLVAALISSLALFFLR